MFTLCPLCSLLRQGVSPPSDLVTEALKELKSCAAWGEPSEEPHVPEGGATGPGGRGRQNLLESREKVEVVEP